MEWYWIVLIAVAAIAIGIFGTLTWIAWYFSKDGGIWR